LPARRRERRRAVFAVEAANLALHVITHFDQTTFEHFNENNAFDAEGLTVLTRAIEERKKIRSDIVAANRVKIEQRTLNANNQSLEIVLAAEQARLTQEQTLVGPLRRACDGDLHRRSRANASCRDSPYHRSQAQTTAQTEADKVTQTATIAATARSRPHRSSTTAPSRSRASRRPCRLH
jgi:flotillin